MTKEVSPANDLISVIERRRREKAVNFARASVGLEGFKTSEEDEARAHQFINGEIELADYVKGTDSPAQTAKSLSKPEYQQLETSFAIQRITELELDPVCGTFDAAHLREINRRVFKDLPGAGFEGVTPGEYRPPVPDGKDWMKNRVLSTLDVSYYVAYSRMDGIAQARLDSALTDAKSEKLRGLKTHEFISSLAKLYVELDYVHPFSDGNSRTLRTFTKQLARESGYELDWERFNESETGRDILYIGRDRAVNQLAMPQVQHEHTMRKIVYSMDRLEGNRDLPALLGDVVGCSAR